MLIVVADTDISGPNGNDVPRVMQHCHFEVLPFLDTAFIFIGGTEPKILLNSVLLTVCLLLAAHVSQFPELG